MRATIYVRYSNTDTEVHRIDVSCGATTEGGKEDFENTADWVWHKSQSADWNGVGVPWCIRRKWQVLALLVRDDQIGLGKVNHRDGRTVAHPAFGQQ